MAHGHGATLRWPTGAAHIDAAREGRRSALKLTRKELTMSTRSTSRISATVAALACTVLSAAALAADQTTPRDSTSAAPPATQADTARQADRTQAVPKDDLMLPKPSVSASGETRDWQSIDKNHDNLISPDEMQQALALQWQSHAANSQKQPK